MAYLLDANVFSLCALSAFDLTPNSDLGAYSATTPITAGSSRG